MSHCLPSDESECSRIPLQHLQEAVEKIAIKNGFRKPRFNVRPGSKVGDNYSSVLFRVNIIDEDTRIDSPKQLSLMVKSAVQEEVLRKMMKYYRAFLNEANFYNLVLGSYTKLLQEKGLLKADEHYPDAARCHWATAGNGVDDDKDALILQDMRPEDFVLHDRRKGQDVHHCRVVLTALAHLHALSFAMESLRPKEFERLRNSVTELLSEDTDFVKLFEEEVMLKNVLGMIEKRFPIGTIQHKKATELCRIARKNIFEVIAPCPDGGNVICHGDCWTNNMLFKYSETGQVERVCLLDFQVTRYGSPVLDLSYFLYTCTEKAMRDEHLGALLRGYHTELQARMRLLGVQDPDKLFSWERFQEHLKRYGRYGFYTGAILIPLFMADDDEVPDIRARVVEEGSGFGNVLTVNAKDTTEHDKRMSDLLEEMVNKEYL